MRFTAFLIIMQKMYQAGNDSIFAPRWSIITREAKITAKPICISRNQSEFCANEFQRIDKLLASFQFSHLPILTNRCSLFISKIFPTFVELHEIRRRMIRTKYEEWMLVCSIYNYVNPRSRKPHAYLQSPKIMRRRSKGFHRSKVFCLQSQIWWMKHDASISKKTWHRLHSYTARIYR